MQQTKTTTQAKNAETTTTGIDLHNYDDRYFLDHDKFLSERGKDGVVDTTAASNMASNGEGDEKKLEDVCDVPPPVLKRPKL